MPKDFNEGLENMREFYTNMRKLDIQQNKVSGIEETKEVKPNILMGKKRPYKEFKEKFTEHVDDLTENKV